MTDRKLVLFLLFVAALGLKAFHFSHPFSDSQETASTYRLEQADMHSATDLGQPKQILPEILEGETIAHVFVSFGFAKRSAYQTAYHLTDNRLITMGIYSQGPPLI